MRLLGEEIAGACTAFQHHLALFPIEIGGECGQIEFGEERSLQHRVDAMHSAELRLLYLVVQHPSIARSLHHLLQSLWNSLSLSLSKEAPNPRIFLFFSRCLCIALLCCYREWRWGNLMKNNHWFSFLFLFKFIFQFLFFFFLKKIRFICVTVCLRRDVTSQHVQVTARHVSSYESVHDKLIQKAKTFNVKTFLYGFHQQKQKKNVSLQSAPLF